MYFDCGELGEKIDGILGRCGARGGGGVDEEYWGLRLEGCGAGKRGRRK